jgi:glucokinase
MVQKSKNRLYIGVDVGGTKIQASLVEDSGRILIRSRQSTPRELKGRKLVCSLCDAVEYCLNGADFSRKSLKAVGVALPGVVDQETGRLIIAPNLNLRNIDVRERLEAALKVPVAIGNDCDLGTLGESCFGAARGAKSVVGIFIGTGIGGGFVWNGQIWRGARSAAMEVGHMIMQIDGPLCGCGNHGCFEALASRTAVEKKIHQAVKKGQKTILTKILDNRLAIIRSGALRKALERKDPLTVSVMKETARILGYGCLTLRHVLDPEIIVLGGGVMEACGQWMFPIIQDVVKHSSLPGANTKSRIVLSALHDDAVVLGAVALARAIA